MVAGSGAQAQTTACDMLKASLAARIEATGVRDHALEAVPASDPTPPDARVIGNCSAGAYKVLYRRTGSVERPAAAPAAPVVARAASPEQKPLVSPDPRSRGRRGPAADPGLQAAAAPQAPSAPAPSPAPPPVADNRMAASAVPAVPDERPQTQGLLGPPPPGGAVGPDRAVPPAGRQTIFGSQVIGIGDAALMPPRTQGGAGPGAAPARWAFVLTAAKWLGAFVLLVLAGLMVAWLMHRSAYDSAGLPRGPKVRSL